MKLEVKGVQLGSLVLSSVPAVLFFIGLLGGVITFFFVENPQTAYLPLGGKLLSTAVFSLLYMLLMAALVVIAAFIYNMLTTVIGMRGVRFEIEEISEGE